jgi:hypothetical protein
MEDLLTIAKDIISKQESAFISGSLGLKRQGIPIRRVPKDIDIVISPLTKFVPLDGMYETHGVENEEYENDYYERKSYNYRGTQVDVFIPLDGVNDMLVSEDYDDTIHYAEIMKMKIMHAHGEHYTRYKHIKDMIHFMNECN